LGFGGFHGTGRRNFVGAAASGFWGRRRDFLTGINHGYSPGLFFELIRPVSSETETFRDLKTANFQEKRVFLQNCESPTNWGTAAIMLPPVVSFKKILQKSYTNVIPK
jgi:hypothetical protein